MRVDPSLVAAFALGVASACAQGGASIPDGGAIDGAVDATPLGPDGCVEASENLVFNGDFEAGASPWIETTNGALPLVREQGNGLPFMANDGTWAAVLGGFNNAQVVLTQTLTVPADATLTHFAASGCWVTEEVAGALDTLRVELIDLAAPTNTLTLIDASNQDAATTCDWTPLERPTAGLSPAASLELRLTVTTDGASVTTFAFDSFAIEATSCR